MPILPLPSAASKKKLSRFQYRSGSSWPWLFPPHRERQRFCPALRKPGCEIRRNIDNDTGLSIEQEGFGFLERGDVSRRKIAGSIQETHRILGFRRRIFQNNCRGNIPDIKGNAIPDNQDQRNGKDNPQQKGTGIAGELEKLFLIKAPIRRRNPFITSSLLSFAPVQQSS